MPDLGVIVVQGLGRQPIMPPFPTLIVNLDQGERFRIAEVMSRAITLLVGVSDEADLSAAVTRLGRSGRWRPCRLGHDGSLVVGSEY